MDTLFHAQMLLLAYQRRLGSRKQFNIHLNFESRTRVWVCYVQIKKETKELYRAENSDIIKAISESMALFEKEQIELEEFAKKYDRICGNI